ncbi:MAG: hypothetical protein CM15mP77_1940 [Synechococcus sp.]|nr:MAG: hypothetical protein CM15mP77_1940 [Synechococcus sp.]
MGDPFWSATPWWPGFAAQGHALTLFPRGPEGPPPGGVLEHLCGTAARGKDCPRWRVGILRDRRHFPGRKLEDSRRVLGVTGQPQPPGSRFSISRGRGYPGSEQWPLDETAAPDPKKAASRKGRHRSLVAPEGFPLHQFSAPPTSRAPGN